jgi:exopolysaccharide production protein ExoZ
LQYYFKFTELNTSLANAFASFLVVYFSAQLEKESLVYIPKVILFFGAASYSLYLIHPVIIPLSPVLLKKTGMILPFLSEFLCVIFALVAGTLSYYYFEKPVTRFLTRAYS